MGLPVPFPHNAKVYGARQPALIHDINHAHYRLVMTREIKSLVNAALPAGEVRLAHELARGVVRLMGDRGWAALTEFTLGNGRRADVMALDGQGRIAIVEVKSSVVDFRSDAKWPDYLDYCDRFYFAVEPAFPHDILPAGEGLILADRFGGSILREAAPRSMAPARRRALILQFGLQAAGRLNRRDAPLA